MKRAAFLLLLAGCGGGSDAEKPGPVGPTGQASSQPDPEPSALRMVDATESSGLASFEQRNGTAAKLTIDQSFGAGVALLDVDGDGDLDAYLTNGGAANPTDPPPRDALLLNDGHGRFTESANSGLSDELFTYGVTSADYDGDGDLDLYVTNRGPNRLYRNDGTGTFVDVAAQAGVAVSAWSTGSRFFDYDGDGDLDLYVVNHIALDDGAVADLRSDFFGLEVYFGPTGLEPAADRLFRQEADGSFTDVSSASGIGTVARIGFHVIAYDWDRDGHTDLYVANDSHPNILWHNQGDGTFIDVAFQVGVARGRTGNAQAGMGIALGDYDLDGHEDLYVTNFSSDYFTLYKGSASGRFRDVTAIAGLYQATIDSLGWAAFLEDLDGDGDPDLFTCNGHVYPQADELDRGERFRQRNQLFENIGGGRFREPVGGGGPGLAIEAPSRGAALGDVDGDGDPDLLVGNLDGPPTLLANESSGGSWVRVELRASTPNTRAFGAVIEATIGGRVHRHTIGAGSGFLSAGDEGVWLGCGEGAGIDGLVVTWPGGERTELGAFEAGHVVSITRGEPVNVTALGRER